jgi:signal transduction histidine kinase
MTQPVALLVQIPARRLPTDGSIRIDSARSLMEAARHLSRLPYDAVIAPLSNAYQNLAADLITRDDSPYAPALFAIAAAPVLVEPFEACLPLESLGAVLPSYLRLRQQRIRDHERHLSALDALEHAQNAARHQPETEIEVLKNAIVKNVSHELKTPLLHVKSAVALLTENQGNTERMNELIEYASIATSRLEGIVKNITMLGDSLDVNPGPILLRDAVEAARRHLRRAWESRTETERIVVDFPQQLPPVYADKQALITVLQLLIDNALKFSEKEVVVRACPDNDNSQVEISVQDYGIGIADDRLGDIFEPFYQVDGSPTRRAGGTGVGLSLVKLILEYHNSEINVDSQLDKGSTFTFRLPIVHIGPR